ncbi:serine/threonine protein kinase [Candidatus Sumerlaeota bacterium]|nr:serine/threonine protein kinase [Candidatus Sumerlaeota bacterium]
MGGYRVTKMLGAGGMGAVCLAHQISLDRQVALKILPSYMAENPDFLMRFTREALSAAQMTHHNIIQIYDIGSDGDIHYISMEYVRGETLTDSVRKQGRIAPETAAGYVLQAARGLQYAHERGIIHRDIKPDNLMINEHGIVKIADMGLAKIRSEAQKKDSPDKADAENRASILQRARGDLTMSEVAMGTPAYMPPEQARDASTVDHRADQYSLGCTLYYLCAGKTPYSGNSAYELINKHLMEPLPPIQQFVPNIPKNLSRVIERMMEKEPDARYPSMTEVIADLEAYLGVSGAKGTTGPREAHVQLLNEAEREFYAVPSLKWQKPAVLGYLGTLSALAIFFWISNESVWLTDLVGKGGGTDIAIAFVCMMILTPVVNFILDGLLNHTFLFKRMRNAFSGIGRKGLLTLVGIAALAVLVFGSKLIFGLFGASLASAAYLLLLRRPLWNQRREPLEKVRLMLKELRVTGLPEESLQEFAAKYTGDNWEEFFEGLFGYASLLAAREKWGLNEAGKPRKQYATWRDPLTRWLDSIEETRKKSREKRRLSDIEAERLKAKGVEETQAKIQADIEASRIMKQGFMEDGTPAIPVSRPAEAAPRKEKAEKAPLAKTPRVLRGRSHRFFELDQWIRLWSGVALLLLYGAHDFLGIALVPDALHLAHYDDILALITGICLVISSFSGRSGTSSLILVGAILMIGMVPISGLVNHPAFPEQVCYGVGLILILIGFGLPLLFRLMGQRY